MPNPVFCLENDGSRVYRVGRIGLDSSGDDDGGVYTGLLRTEKWAPLGEGEDVFFRSISVKVRHTGAFTSRLRAYVDGSQTQYYDGDTPTDQEITYAVAAPLASVPGGVKETLLEMGLQGRGNHIEVELEVDSDEITGVFLPEYIEVKAVETRLQREGGVVSGGGVGAPPPSAPSPPSLPVSGVVIVGNP